MHPLALTINSAFPASTPLPSHPSHRIPSYPIPPEPIPLQSNESIPCHPSHPPPIHSNDSIPCHPIPSPKPSFPFPDTASSRMHILILVFDARSDQLPIPIPIPMPIPTAPPFPFPSPVPPPTADPIFRPDRQSPIQFPSVCVHVNPHDPSTCETDSCTNTRLHSDPDMDPDAGTLIYTRQLFFKLALFHYACLYGFVPVFMHHARDICYSHP